MKRPSSYVQLLLILAAIALAGCAKHAGESQPAQADGESPASTGDPRGNAGDGLGSAGDTQGNGGDELGGAGDGRGNRGDEQASSGDSGDAGLSGGDAAPPPVGGPVTITGVYNARQVGGLTSAGGQRVRQGVLIRSGHLATVDATGCSDLDGLGIQTIIDLRTAAAAALSPDADCATSGRAFYQADLPKILPPSADSYLQTLEAAEPKLADIIGHLAAPGGLPVIIHCVIGRDRASLITALVLAALGVPEADILTDFTDNQEAAVDSEWLQAVFDQLDLEGGVDAYLISHGVTDEQLTALRAAALE